MRIVNFANSLLEKGLDRQIALLVGKERVTYRSLRCMTAQIAVQLREYGIEPGDRVALLGANSSFWVAAYIAVFHIGAAAVPLPTTIQSDEFTQVKQFSDFKALCLSRRASRRLPKGLTDDLPLILDDQLAALEEVALGDVPIHPISDERTEAAFMLTSGTTSKPKLVRVSHGNLQSNTDSIIEYLHLTAADRIMVAMPFYYCFGLSLLHTHLQVGGSAVLNNRFAFPESVLDEMEATQCTGFAGVPSMYHTLLRKTTFPKRPFPHLKKVQQAGGHLPPVLVQELRQSLPAADIYVMYGQTEATARLSYLPPHKSDSKLGSIGQAIPGVKLCVVDQDGNKASPGDVGEIMAFGGCVTLGYLDNAEATAQKYVNGGLRTGDLATIDEDGFIFIVDRESDILKPLGTRVSSKKIESIVMELPQLVHSAVVGVSDLEKGEAIYVYAVTAANAQISEQDVLEHCKGRLPRGVAPTGVEFVKRLPLNRNGKVVRVTLRQMAVERHKEQV
ncbi:MAG: AMP-binding protein [Chloroflexi bacterium]|nr:AMP-binding protein [Chloroflexota bacterium]